MPPSHKTKTTQTSTTSGVGTTRESDPGWAQTGGNAEEQSSLERQDAALLPSIFDTLESQQADDFPDSQVPPGTPGGLLCDACHEESWSSEPIDRHRGPQDGRKVGTWLGEITDVDLRAGAAYRPRFDDLGTATGYARSLAQAAVVLREEDGYRVFELEHNWVFADFTRQSTSNCGGRANITMESGVFVFMTEDSWAITASNCGADGSSGGIAHEALSDGPGTERFQQILDARGEGFEEHSGTDSGKLASFEVAMRMLMLDILESAEQQALQRPGEFEANYSQVITVAEAIHDTEGQLDDLKVEHERAVAAQDCNACHEVATVDLKARELMEQRATLRLKFPLLSRFEPISDFLAQSEDEQAASIGHEAGSVVVDIRKTRDNLENGALELWTLPPLIQATLQAGGFDDPGFQQQVLDRAAEAQWEELISGLAMAALSVGLGLAACAATGGLGVALGAAAIGVGVVDAAWQTAEYFEDVSLSNTAEDKSQGLMSPEQMQGAEFWLAVAWVSAGIDLASGIKVVGLLRAGASIGKALRTAGHVGKEAKLIGATLAKNIGEELHQLGSHIEADPAWAMAGGRGSGPYDRVGRTPQVPNEEVRALRPDGWASEGTEGSNVHAMSMGDQWDQLSFPAGGQTESTSGRQATLGDGVEELAIHGVSKGRAGMARRPRHHAFPNEQRTWFEDRGFVGDWDIDNFTIELDQGVHQAIHGGGDWRSGRALSEAKASASDLTPQMRAELDAWAGEWNTTVMRDLTTAQTRKGADLTRDEVMEIVLEDLQLFGLESNFVPYRGP